MCEIDRARVSCRVVSRYTRENVCLLLSQIIHQTITGKKKKKKERDLCNAKQRMARCVLAIAPCSFFRSFVRCDCLCTFHRSRFQRSFSQKVDSTRLEVGAPRHLHRAKSSFFFPSRIVKLSPSLYRISRQSPQSFLSFLFPGDGVGRGERSAKPQTHTGGRRSIYTGRRSDARIPRARKRDIARVNRPAESAALHVHVSSPRVTVISNVTQSLSTAAVHTALSSSSSSSPLRPVLRFPPRALPARSTPFDFDLSFRSNETKSKWSSSRWLGNRSYNRCSISSERT